ncbi:MAG: polyprenyl synthetase family protein [Candidatus Poseidoniaceae archaeon]|jgi:geranylgeranyl pyrophosphate synthase|nr:polyprenyl synthetase family protein [Candidatus Poseidoniaceae archaeon]MDP7203423.1 polyprenyl synthetase family protein [Candidatus Poseidoniaceae archaeon]
MTDALYFEDKMQSCKALIEAELEALLERAVIRDGEVAELASAMVFAGGKRARPILILLAYELSGGIDFNEVMPMALAFELIHTATLIHDDIHDAAKYRRGIQTIHDKHGLAKAIIAGDWLFVQGFALGGRYGDELIDLVAYCCGEIATAELKQLSHISDLATTPEDYEEVVRGKTAGPFAVGCEIAGLIAGCDKEDAAALGRFGLQLGIVFQLVDDLLDLLGDARLGKPRGADVLEGKMTLPLIHGLTMLHGDARLRLAEVIDGFNEGSWEELIELLEQAGSIEYSKALIRTHMERGLEELDRFVDSEAKRVVISLAQQLMDREI